MQQNKNCPYCGVPLRNGKGGNTRGCFICEQQICVNCIQFGVCKTHLDSSDSDQIVLLRKNNQYYWILQMIGIFLPLFIIWYFSFFREIPEVYVLWYLLAEFLLFVLIIINVVIIRKAFIRRAKKIFNSQSNSVKII